MYCNLDHRVTDTAINAGVNTAEAWREDTGGGSDTIKAALQERMMAHYMTPLEDVVSGPKLLTDAQEPWGASTRPYLEDGLTTVWTEHVQDVLANEPVRRDSTLVSKAYEIGKKSVNDTIDQWFYDPVTAEAVAMDSVLLNALSPWRKFGKIQRAGKTVLGKAAKRVGEDVAHKAGSPRAAPGKQPTTQSSATGAPRRIENPYGRSNVASGGKPRTATSKPAGMAKNFPALPKGYHYKSVDGKIIVSRNPGSYGRPQLRLEGDKVVEISLRAKKMSPKPIHKNANAYAGKTHLYVIRNGQGKILKYGETSRGFNKKGQLKRAQEQARKLERKNPGKKFKSDVVRDYGSKWEARHGPRGERKYIETHRKAFGKDSLPLNKNNR